MGKHGFLLTRASLFILLLSLCATSASAQDDDDSKRERIAAERYQKLLERAPKRGTAFDRVYGYLVETSGLADYIARLQADSATDGKAALILGMVESRRGNDAKAAAAFTSAEKLLADNPLPSQYLAQSQISVGKPNEAVQAFERALERSKQPTERLEIYKALGRTHQRSFHQDEALNVWKRMEEEFPSNIQVQEEIATALAEDGLNEQALERYAQLAKLSSDNYRKVTYSIRQAELLVRLKRSDDAISKLESISETLKPDGWLHRDVRDRIEHVFLRNDDFEGLATYLQEWVKSHPDDVDALARLGQTLASQGRHEEASETLSKAIDSAPSNVKLRELLIQAFTRANDYEKALEQYAELHRIDASNIDHLIRWGQTASQNPQLKEAERQTAAAKVWKKILDKDGEDPVRIIRVAELLRGIDQVDDSIALYRKAVKLSDNPTQYLEYLGEYLHKLDRKDEAMAAWQQMAAGKLETPDNLLRLSEVYSEFGLDEKAIETVAKAAEMEPDRFDIQRSWALRLMDVEKWEDALARLDIAETHAESVEDTDNIFKKRVEALRSGELLAAKTDELEAELNAGTNITANRWTDLARYAYALSDMKRSVAAIGHALELDDSSIHVAITAAEVYESSGQLGDATKIRNRLADIDRRFRSVHLMKVAELHMQLGQKEEAYAAGRKVLEVAGSGPDQARFFADLCFRLDKEKEAIDTLRRNVRLNPNDINVQWTLAQALAIRFKTTEAIEVYWQSFEKCEQLDEKLRVIGMLSDLYLRTNQFEKFLARLERQNLEAEDRRMTTMCLAQAYREIRDYASARMELEKLLAEESKDTQLLGELSKLSEAERDYPTAIKYQRRIVEVASTPQEDNRLAELFVKQGDIKAAEKIWARMAVATPEFHTALKSVDGLMSKERWEAASAIVEQLEGAHPGDWELLYRRAVIADWQKDEEGAKKHFTALMNMPVPRDTKAAQVVAATKLIKRGRGQSNQPMFASIPLQDRIDQISSMRYVTGHSRVAQDYHKRRALDWKPGDFGQARLAATGWLYKKDGRGWKENGIHKAVRTATYPDDAPTEALWNLYEFQRLQYSGDQSYLVAERLAKRGSMDAHYALLTSVSGRRNHKDEENKKGTEERNQLQLKSFWTLRRERPDWDVMRFVPVLMKDLKDVGGKESQKEFFTQLQADLKTPIDRIQFINAAREMRVPQLILTATQEAGKSFANLRQNVPEHRSQLERRISELYRSGNSQAKQKKYKLSLQFFDAVMESLDLIQKGQRSSSNYASTLMGSRDEYYVYTYETDKSKYARLSYPQESKFFNRKRIEALRNWYVFFTRDNKLNLLIDHLKNSSTPIDDSPAAKQKAMLARLARSYIHGWSEEPEKSVFALTEAQELVPDDIGLLIELVMLQSNSGQLNLALANIDAFQPLNRSEMQDRELVALNLAVKTGQLDRARTAAERLFGLRLSNDIELLLAQQMNQLGMFELSKTVMDRARQKVSRNAGSLVKLMQQYNSQGQKDTAHEVALQLLQGTRRQSVRPGYYNETNSAREQALRLLSGSGKLKELTVSVEKQLERSPKSDALMRTLLEYYQGSGEKEKAAKLSARLLDARDDDPQLRFDIAQQQAQQGDHEKAMDNFLIAIKQKPELLQNGYHRMRNSLRSTKRGEDLANTLMEIDLNKIGQPWAIGNTVEMLFQNPETKTAGYKLFDKAWENVEDKVELLRSVSFQQDFWQEDGAWKYAKAFLLNEEKKTSFYFFGNYAGSSSGKLIGPFSKALEVATRMDKLEEIETAIRETKDNEKAELVNTTLLAIIDAYLERPEKATDKLQEILGNKKAEISSNASRVIGQVLEGIDGMDSIVVQLYERTIDEVLRDEDEVYNQSVGRALFASYKKLGNKDKARALLLRFAKRTRQVPSYNLEYEAQRTLSEQHELGKDLLELGYPIDAIRILNKGASNKKAKELASRWGGSNYDFKSTIASAVVKLKDLPAEELLDGLLPDPESFEPQENTNAVELGLIVQPETLNDATVNSLVTQVLTESTGEVSEEAAKKIAALQDLAPKDCSLALVNAAVNMNNENAVSAFADLQAILAEDLPEKPLPAELEARIAVWTLTKAAAANSDLEQLLVDLTKSAIAAAKQHPDQKWLMAIRREQAEQFANNKDMEKAKAAYSELINLAIAPQSTLPVKKDSPATKSANGRTLTSDQFDKVIQIAENAAAKGLTDFAVNSIADSLKNGPPIDPISLDQLRNRSVVQSFGTGSGSGEDQRLAKVAAKLKGLSATWKTQNIDAAPVYRMLKSLVLPEDKDVIHPYWANAGSGSDSSGLLNELIQWAEKTEKTGELLDALSGRKNYEGTEVTAQIAALMIHQKSKNVDASKQILTQLRKALEESKQASSAMLIARAAASTCQNKELANESLELMLTCAANMQPQMVSQFDNSIQQAVANAAESLDAERATKLLDRYLATVDPRKANDNNNAEYSAYLRQQQLSTAIMVLLDKELLAPAMKYISEAQSVDASQYGEFNLPGGANRIRNLVTKLPQDEQYELLSEWILPKKNLTQIGELTGIPTSTVPNRYLKLAGKPENTQSAAPLTIFGVLLDSAEATGKLKELAELVATRKPRTADEPEKRQVETLLNIRMKNHDAVMETIKQRIEEIAKQTPEETATQQTGELMNLTSDGIIGITALEVSSLEDAGRELLQACNTYMKRKGYQSTFTTEILKPHIEAAYGQSRTILPDPGLTHWIPAMVLSIGGGIDSSVWASDGKLVSQVAKKGYSHMDYLTFRYPLRGAFEVSFQSATDGIRGMTMTYGGVNVMADYNGRQSVYVNSTSATGSQGTAQLTAKRNEDFDTWKLLSDGEQVEYQFNGEAVFTDKSASASSPWLQLQGASYGGGPVTAKGITIKGTPEIPSQVSLLAGDRLDGWSSIFYYELMKGSVTDRFDDKVTIQTYNQGTEVAQPWSVTGGVLTGETTDKTEYSKYSWLNYCRPLLDGEKIEYEFFYKKDSDVVHPAIGRSAFLLTDDGIRLHWMNAANYRGQGAAQSAIKDDNEFNVAEYRKGPAKLPLLEDDWNNVVVERTGDQISLKINAMEVYSYPLDSEDLTNFGFFRNRTTDKVQVRNITLSGDWPTELTPEILADLLAQDEDLTDSQRAARKKLIDFAAQ